MSSIAYNLFADAVGYCNFAKNIKQDILDRQRPSRPLRLCLVRLRAEGLSSTYTSRLCKTPGLGLGTALSAGGLPNQVGQAELEHESSGDFGATADEGEEG